MTHNFTYKHSQLNPRTSLVKPRAKALGYPVLHLGLLRIKKLKIWLGSSLGNSQKSF